MRQGTELKKAPYSPGDRQQNGYWSDRKGFTKKETSARESEYQVPQNLKVKREINWQSLILTNKIHILFALYHPLEVSGFRQIFLIENQQYYCGL